MEASVESQRQPAKTSGKKGGDKDYVLEDKKESLHDSVNPSKEKALAELFKVCPEITQAVKENLGDTTTLWSLAALARLATKPEMFELEIRIVCDVLRQRVLDGVNGDTAHAKHSTNQENKPEFLKKVTLGSLPEACGVTLKEKLNEMGFSYSKTNGWWAWESKERVAFVDMMVKDGIVTQTELLNV